MSGIAELGALALSAAIRNRSVSCREVMSAFLDRIDRLNPTYNAIVSLCDRDDLIGQADACDAQLARGEYLGWMHGFPQAIKDLSPTRGIRTTRGSPLFAETIPTEDSLLVERARRAGAIIIGKTNTPEFGLGSQTYNRVFGVTRNAYDASRCAGGSSGGAAVALALRLLPVADGSDMGGSLRNPAAFNNVYGFRPSQGRVPSWPAVEAFVQQMTCEGPMGRSVSDVAMLLSSQAGYDRRVPLSLADDPQLFAQPLDRDFSTARVGWLGDLDAYLPIEPGILELCRQGLAVLEGIGCRVEAAALGFDPALLWQSWVRLRNCMVCGGLAELYDDPAKRAQMKPEAVWEIERGLATSAQQLFHASRIRTEWFAQVCRLFETFDYLVLPTAQVFPFDADEHWPKTVAGRPMDSYHRWMEIVTPWTLSGCPVLNVPVGFGAAGLPMGMQLIGPPRADLAVLQLGHAYDRATDWVQRQPPPAAR